MAPLFRPLLRLPNGFTGDRGWQAVATSGAIVSALAMFGLASALGDEPFRRKSPAGLAPTVELSGLPGFRRRGTALIGTVTDPSGGQVLLVLDARTQQVIGMRSTPPVLAAPTSAGTIAIGCPSP